METPEALHGRYRREMKYKKRIEILIENEDLWKTKVSGLVSEVKYFYKHGSEHWHISGK